MKHLFTVLLIAVSVQLQAQEDSICKIRGHVFSGFGSTTLMATQRYYVDLPDRTLLIHDDPNIASGYCLRCKNEISQTRKPDTVTVWKLDLSGMEESWFIADTTPTKKTTVSGFTFHLIDKDSMPYIPFTIHIGGINGDIAKYNVDDSTFTCTDSFHTIKHLFASSWMAHQTRMTELKEMQKVETELRALKDILSNVSIDGYISNKKEFDIAVKKYRELKKD